MTNLPVGRRSRPGLHPTFSLGVPEGTPRGYEAYPITVDVRQRLEPLIIEAFRQRGYSLVPDKGDFFARFGSGRRQVAVHESSEIGGSWLPDDENADFVEGALVVDAFDSQNLVRVWHGRSSTASDPSFRDAAFLRRLVTELLGAFPMRTATQMPGSAGVL